MQVTIRLTSSHVQLSGQSPCDGVTSIATLNKIAKEFKIDVAIVVDVDVDVDVEKVLKFRVKTIFLVRLIFATHMSRNDPADGAEVGLTGRSGLPQAEAMMTVAKRKRRAAERRNILLYDFS